MNFINFSGNWFYPRLWYGRMIGKKIMLPSKMTRSSSVNTNKQSHFEYGRNWKKNIQCANTIKYTNVNISFNMHDMSSFSSV